MNVDMKSGYKLTEVGVIPEDWTIRHLWEIVDLQVGYAFKSSWFTKDDGIPLLRGENVGYGRPDWSIKQNLPLYESNKFSDYILSPSDIVIGMDRTFTRSGAKISLLKAEDCPSLLVQRVGKFIPKKCTSNFLWALLSFGNYHRSLELQQTGMDIPHLSRSEILSPMIALPSTLAEQEAIAEVLSDADAYIESLEQLIAKKRLIKQGAMQTLTRPKEGWVPKKLGNIGEFSKGRGIRKDESLSGNLPCIRYGEIYTHHHNYVKRFYSWISKSVAGNSQRIKPNDILFAGSGETKAEIGKCVAFIDDIEVYAGGDIVILRPENINSLFLGYYLNTSQINRQKASKGQGDAVVHISSAALSTIDLWLPTLKEQTAIATTLSDMDAEITALEEKLAKAWQLKQGMMAELLTGKTRLVKS
ncbi:MAG: restriction endonuclease subunit S [Chloroflexota bacterium]